MVLSLFRLKLKESLNGLSIPLSLSINALYPVFDSMYSIISFIETLPSLEKLTILE